MFWWNACVGAGWLSMEGISDDDIENDEVEVNAGW